jgi:hypothetical protein
MDFKVAGSRRGLTAVQLDMKVPGLPPGLLAEALVPARAAREALMAAMEAAVEACSEPRADGAMFGSVEVQKELLVRRGVGWLGRLGWGGWGGWWLGRLVAWLGWMGRLGWGGWGGWGAGGLGGLGCGVPAPGGGCCRAGRLVCGMAGLWPDRLACTATSQHPCKRLACPC